MINAKDVAPFEVMRVGGGLSHPDTDRIAVERALEVRLNGEPFSVIMRTPGDDESLAAGFLFTEGVVRVPEDLASIDTSAAADIVDVRLGEGRSSVLSEILSGRRQVAMNSSCGMCGRRSLESLDVAGTRLDVAWTVPAEVIATLPAALRMSQAAFAETGGLHAAGLFDLEGRLIVSAEDVGRHNAVDKIIGRMLLGGRLPLGGSLLFVSGRSSFEIVQKAWLAGIPFLGAVSAPSSLAVELAREAGMTLLGFVRDERFNVYAHHERVAVARG